MSHSPIYQPNSQARPALFCANCAQVKPLPNSEFLARAVLITGIALAVFALLIFSVVTSPLAVVSPFVATVCLTAAVTGVSLLFTYFMIKSFGTGGRIDLSRKSVEQVPFQQPFVYQPAMGGSPAVGSPIPGSPRMQGQAYDNQLSMEQFAELYKYNNNGLSMEEFYNICVQPEQDFALDNRGPAGPVSGKGKQEAGQGSASYSMLDPRYYLYSNPPQQY